MSKKKTQDRSVFCPTLLIGLGGTGSEILLSVREQVKRNNQDTLNKFLFIDTDIRSASAKKGYTKMDNSEICIVGTKNARNYNDPSNSRMYKGIINRFPLDELNSQYVDLLSMGTGAAQIRSLGALAFALDYATIRKNIEKSIYELSQAKNRQVARAQGGTIKPESITVYIVGSLAGGTGSGCFIDAAVVARDVSVSKTGWGTTVIGVFTLPDGYDRKLNSGPMERATRTNTYSSLMELQYLFDRKFDKITFDYDTGNAIEISGSHKVFDMVYLVDNKNTSGTITLENMYEVVATSIYQDIGTPFGTISQSALINMDIFTGGNPDPKSREDRIFSSLSGSSLVYPARRVAEYCTNSSLSEVISDKILGGNESLGWVNNKVDSFLKGNDLEDRHPKNQIIDQLRGIESSSLKIDPIDFVDDKGVDKFLTVLDSETDYINRLAKQKVNNLAEENKKNILHGESGETLNKLEDLVSEWVIGIAIANGVNTAVKVLQRLENVCKIMGDQLKTEQSDWEAESKKLENEIDQHRTQLGDVGWFDRKLGKHKEIIDRTIDLYNELVDKKLENYVKSHAIEIVDVLGATTSELLAKWSNLVRVLQEIQNEGSDEALHLETRKSQAIAATSRFATEFDVTEPGHESDYYKKNYKAPLDVYRGIVKMYCENQDNEYSEEMFIAWLYKAANRSKANAIITGQMKKLIFENFWANILETNIVQYIRNTENAEAFIEAKLEMLFELCAPFWQLGSHMLGTLDFPEIYGVSVKHEKDDEGGLVAPVEIAQWSKRYTKDGTQNGVIDTEIPYKISLNKRVHGARAYFLSATPSWEKMYKERLRNSKGRYMIHVHSAFNNIPLLPPTDNESMQAFAKGMALGFIVKRGDIYYYGLEDKYDMATNSTNIEIGYKGHWKTIHDLKGVPAIPEHCGALWFKLDVKSPPEEMKIGRGRENALNELMNHEEWTTAIESAFTEYYKQVGMDLRYQLAKYIEEILEPAARKATGSNKTLLNNEQKAIKDWAQNNS